MEKFRRVIVEIRTYAVTDIVEADDEDEARLVVFPSFSKESALVSGAIVVDCAPISDIQQLEDGWTQEDTAQAAVDGWGLHEGIPCIFDGQWPSDFGVMQHILRTAKTSALCAKALRIFRKRQGDILRELASAEDPAE